MHVNVIWTIEIKITSQKTKSLSHCVLSWERERERERGEEDRILLCHMYRFANEQVYFNHKEEKRWKDRQKKVSILSYICW